MFEKSDKSFRIVISLHVNLLRICSKSIKSLKLFLQDDVGYAILLNCMKVMCKYQHPLFATYGTFQYLRREYVCVLWNMVMVGVGSGSQHSTVV